MLRWLASFDNTNEMLGVFTGVNGYIGSVEGFSSPGRLGPYCVELSGNGNPCWAWKVMPSSQNQWTVGCAFMAGGRFNSFSYQSATELIWVCDITGSSGGNANNLIQFGVGISTDMGVYALLGNGTRQYSKGGLWRIQTWNYIEVNAIIGASETVTVKLNGVTVLTLTGVNTQKTGNSTANLIALVSLSADMFYNDVYACDGNAAAHGPANNAFLGDIAVLCQFPNAAGNYSQWTPTTAPNYSCVNAYAQSDTVYVSSATANQIDSYKFPATLATTGQIAGVQENVIARTDAGTHVVAPFYRNGGTDYEQTGSEATPGSTYGPVQAQFDYDPNSNSQWTPVILNAGEFGQELVS
jgi:hypothetical protein